MKLNPKQEQFCCEYADFFADAFPNEAGKG